MRGGGLGGKKEDKNIVVEVTSDTACMHAPTLLQARCHGSRIPCSGDHECPPLTVDGGEGEGG